MRGLEISLGTMVASKFCSAGGSSLHMVLKVDALGSLWVSKLDNNRREIIFRNRSSIIETLLKYLTSYLL